MLNQINSDWTEKYRPQTLDDMILNAESRALIDKYLAEGIIDNILLCSRPGQGKTSLAKLLPIIFDCLSFGSSVIVISRPSILYLPLILSSIGSR